MIKGRVLVQEIEIEEHPSRIVAEELAVVRIGNITVRFQRVEVVGQIRHWYRDSDGVFLGDLKILGHQNIEGEVAGKSWLASTPGGEVLLQYVDGLVRETVAQLKMWIQLEFPRQSIGAPKQETVGNFIGQTRYQSLMNHWEREIANVAAGIVDVAPRMLPDVREKELPLWFGADPCSEFVLMRPGSAR